MSTKILFWISGIYDRIYGIWEDTIVKNYLGPVMVLIYVAALVLIEFKLRGHLPEWLSCRVAESHFTAVYIAFSLLLVFEVVDLIFGITKSVSRAFGKQMEIFAIILIRNSFKSFESAGEPIMWQGASEILPRIISDSLGALFIIFLLAGYYKLLRRNPITDPNEKKISFIRLKKMISLVLLCVFMYTGISSGAGYLFAGVHYAFFPFFFTVLILSDILLVLISLCYASSFPIVFRNSGFAVATVLLRIGLTAPIYFDAGIGIIAGVYAIGITIAYNYFQSEKKLTAR